MNYQHCLDVAISAALEAGQLLRNDFNRSGGPSGQDAHSPADNDAEALIRQRLTAAFPDFGQRGEELGDLNKAAQDAQLHIWSIDPNDGTSAFIKGWRGAAVSIGLLRAGLPVLGVVYAYAERSGLGDLIAWAEGQPLTRNGENIAVDRAALQPNVILISQNADKSASVSAAMCRPYRYRISPSIAYRLALVAVGEAVAAISLVSPTVWDVAAGHALLRAVGMDLYQRTGAPVRYAADGYGSVGDCIGCHADIAHIWTDRDWKKAFSESGAATSPGFTLSKPQPQRIVADADRLNRAQGCLVGLLAGDNLGAQVEFLNAAEIAESFPDGLRNLEDGGPLNLLAGQATDDGEMALMLARSIVQSECYSPDQAAKAYLYWYHSDPFDIGNTIGAVLSAAASINSHTPAEACRQAAVAYAQSQANGALMRIAPLAVWGIALDNDVLADLARQDAQLTHQHPICQDANAVFCVALAAAIRGESATTIYQQTLAWSRVNAVHHDVIEAVVAAEHSPPVEYFQQMGWVLIALQNAFFQLLHAKDGATGIQNTIIAGGDTDTNAAIAGALLGAVYGVHALPRQWLHALLSARSLPESGSQISRPEAFWPVDCLILAERLLWLGMNLGEKT
ncbi:MAG: inositol monophosphatase family protein [Methylococcales bacterium]